jgi:chaperonin GroEL (HSP60 family)
MSQNNKQSLTSQDNEKSKDIRRTNIVAARAVADVVRTSLGPKGMDKMVSIHILFSLLIFIFLIQIDPRSKR